jgi:hypothetical protein
MATHRALLVSTAEMAMFSVLPPWANSQAQALTSEPADLQTSDGPTLHALIDGSVIELIVSGPIGYTKRFYYEASTAPEVTCVAAGAEILFDARNIASISGDRLTT